MNYLANAAAGALSRLHIRPDTQIADEAIPAASGAVSALEAWVINLKRRPDRLEDFHNRLSSLRPFVNIQRFDAVDSQRLNTGALASRINPWWCEQLAHYEFSGYMAVCLSHLAVWELAAESPGPKVLVFEDDASFARRGCLSRLMAAWREAPLDADLVWLNVDIWPREHGNLRWFIRRVLRNLPAAMGALPLGPRSGPLHRREQFWRWTGAYLKTSEAYLITPAFARVLHDKISNDLGPIDVLIRDWIGRLGARAYELRVPIFTQTDRKESDRDLTGKSVIGHPPARS